MILTLKHGAVRELRLNRPPANALGPELITALAQALDAADREGARALVLSGLPGIFSAGLDVPRLLTLDRAALAAVWRNFYVLMRALASSPIPISAAITGHAPAGGTVLTLFCDWRVMAEGQWKIGLNEVQVGLPLPPVIFSALRRQVGSRAAERLAAGGVLLSPGDARAVGLIDDVVPADQVIPRAVEWCEGMLRLPAAAMTSTRKRVRADLAALFDQNYEDELEATLVDWWSAEAQSTLRALTDRLGKKAP
jgi:enoyl-CoA hydratase/carnithine racemase